MKAIVFTSATGHTAEYAKMLGDKTGLPVYAWAEAKKQLDRGTPILYLGWVMAHRIQGYKKAAKRFPVAAVCAVGLCDTGTMTEEVRHANSLPASVPLFTLQGGMDKTKLRGIHKFMIQMLIKGLSSQKERSESDEHMLALLTHGENCVSEENMRSLLEWYRQQAQ